MVRVHPLFSLRYQLPLLSLAAARSLAVAQGCIHSCSSLRARLRAVTASTCVLRASTSMLCLTPPARLHGHGENERQPTLDPEAQLCIGFS